ncbi:MAG: SBBP repeat-containing protein [Candidatus Tectimicrobiota bacterium]
MTRYGTLPLYFIENRGQVTEPVRYYVKGHGATIFFTPDEVVFAVRNHESQQVAQYRVRYLGARPEAPLAGLKKEAATVNYFIGTDPARWRQGIATYSEIGIEELYPGIDLIYRGKAGTFEYEFRVRPGGDPADIAIAYRGVKSLRIDDGENLVIETDAGEVVEEKPHIYQDIDGTRVDVAGGFSLAGPTTVAFAVSDYRRDAPLIIDPVLAYSTFLGGSDFDYARAIAIDATGAVYVTGRTESRDLPTAGPLNNSLGGRRDAFVIKLNPSGSGLVYATYVGGRSGEEGYAIAVDADGAAYVTGYTSSVDFPVTSGTVQTTFAGGRDAFVAKLNASGRSLVYATYLGGENDDYGQGIAVDADGAAYVTGETHSSDFPRANPIDDSFEGTQDAFVTKLNPAGSGLVYSTLLGGGSSDEGWGIAVDATGAAYVTGRTNSSDFPTASPLQAAKGGDHDAFVTKLNPAGGALVYSTFLGGRDRKVGEAGRALAIDQDGAVYVTGYTDSADFPTASPIQAAKGGGIDAFVTKLNPAGSTLVYSTYLGGEDNDEGWGLAVDATGAAYVAGRTDSPDFPTASPIQAAQGGTEDCRPNGS